MEDSKVFERGMALSSLDGRYAERVDELRPIASEYGLMERRALVEIEWFKVMGSGVVPGIEPFSEDAIQSLEDIYSSFGQDDFVEIKQIEKTTNHDLQAVIQWLQGKVAGIPEIANRAGLVHFGCTSEDINNLAYAMMLRDARDEVLLPQIDGLGYELEAMAHDTAEMPLLSLTHGQPATPTTIGKEIAVFTDRLSRAARSLGSISIMAKFNGATGNYAADSFAYPDVDWEAISRDFVEGLGFEFNEYTTQIEQHDYMVQYANALALVNSISIDLATDMWDYIKRGIFSLQKVKGEKGSTAMPNKVNPIHLENAEANLGIDSALLCHLAQTLPISRLQRDLSDSALQRIFGEAFGYSLVGIKSLRTGMNRSRANEAQASLELDQHWEVLAEAIKTILLKNNTPDAYDIVKDRTRGLTFSESDYHDLIEALGLPDDDKARLQGLRPHTYNGQAARLAERVIYSHG